MNRGRKMKKRILSLLLVMVFVLAGCQSSSDKSEDKTTIIYGKAAGPYTVLFEDAIIPILKKKVINLNASNFQIYCKMIQP